MNYFTAKKMFLFCTLKHFDKQVVIYLSHADKMLKIMQNICLQRLDISSKC